MDAIRAEKMVYDQLVRREIEAFLPTVQRWSRWKDRKKKIDWPLFPGYCFARFDPTRTLPVLQVCGRGDHRLVQRKTRTDPRR